MEHTLIANTWEEKIKNVLIAGSIQTSNEISTFLDNGVIFNFNTSIKDDLDCPLTP